MKETFVMITFTNCRHMFNDSWGSTFYCRQYFFQVEFKAIPIYHFFQRNNLCAIRETEQQIYSRSLNIFLLFFMIYVDVDRTHGCLIVIFSKIAIVEWNLQKRAWKLARFHFQKFKSNRRQHSKILFYRATES